MSKTANPRARAAHKSRRLTDAAVAVLHRQGIERTTLADIAREADVPVGNVYYYFKTKDDLVRAALSEHGTYQDTVTTRLDQLDDPRERLKGLIQNWIDLRDMSARHGCPTAGLATELGKRADGTLGEEAADLFRGLLGWIARQFAALGRPDADDLALTLLSAYEGMSLLANVLKDPQVVSREGARLLTWVDELR